MKINLPSSEESEKRQRTCKTWIIAISACLISPSVLLFSYRQKRYEYAVVFLLIAASVIVIRSMYPTPPISGGLFISLVNCFFYSRYGPAILHAYGAWNIAEIIKKGAIKNFKSQ